MLDGIINSMDISFKYMAETAKDREALACRSPWDHKEADMRSWMKEATFFKGII